MEENTNQVQEQTAIETEGKTFSQEDVNRIVGERLAKEKAKNESDWQQREQDLQKRELRMTAKEYLNEKICLWSCWTRSLTQTKKHYKRALQLLKKLLKKKHRKPSARKSLRLDKYAVRHQAHQSVTMMKQ